MPTPMDFFARRGYWGFQNENKPAISIRSNNTNWGQNVLIDRRYKGGDHDGPLVITETGAMALPRLSWRPRTSSTSPALFHPGRWKATLRARVLDATITGMKGQTKRRFMDPLDPLLIVSSDSLVASWNPSWVNWGPRLTVSVFWSFKDACGPPITRQDRRATACGWGICYFIWLKSSQNASPVSEQNAVVNMS